MYSLHPSSKLTSLRSKASVFFALGLATLVFAGLKQDDDIPAEFVSPKVSDPVSKMLQTISAGTLKLEYDSQQGYLKSILKALGLSTSSQILVFSKTSLQTPYISPNTPRAIYFSDRACVAWIPGAPNIEMIGIDPQIGPVFY